ncbi:holo-ACP synthase [Streptomyces anulatus]|uniref:holo-ACP synthase n=1 Tax=Streptomyces anulatus TaxID=1892 RepID=UPI00341882CB
MRIGVDVLAIGELDRLHTCGWFRQHTYDQEELELAGSLSPSREREFLAGRFAAKEAVLKVLGTGFGNGISPAHVRVLRDGRSAPSSGLFTAHKTIVSTYELGPTRAEASEEPALVCRAVGTAVVPPAAARRNATPTRTRAQNLPSRV